MIKRYILLLCMSLLLWACPLINENSATNSTVTTVDNIPVTVSEKDKFTFAVQADAFSMDKSTIIDFSTGELLMVHTITRQSGGGSISFLDKDSNTLKTIDLALSQVSTNRLSLDATPATAIVKLDNFSGNISFVLKK